VFADKSLFLGEMIDHLALSRLQIFEALEQRAQNLDNMSRRCIWVFFDEFEVEGGFDWRPGPTMS
jgi:hypothetical protein